jgi:hypothetical protein
MYLFIAITLMIALVIAMISISNEQLCIMQEHAKILAMRDRAIQVSHQYVISRSASAA